METPIINTVTNDPILDSVPFPLLSAGADRAVYFANSSWLQLTGRTPEQELGYGWMENIHPDDQNLVHSMWTAAFERQKNIEFDLRLRDTTGAFKPFTSRLQPILDAEGFFTGFTVGFMEAAGKASGEIVQMQQEHAAELSVLREKLAGKDLEQGRNNAELESFTYIASHDLQEPLRKIQSFSKMIIARESEKLSEQAQNYFQRIMAAAERMQRLIDDLLSYSSTNVSERSFETVDLNAILNEVRANFQELIVEKKVVINAGQLPALPVIRFQIHQLFTNILANALKFCKQDSPILIDINASIVHAENIRAIDEILNGQYWEITFADNGIGFEQQYEGRIFELFQRLHGKNEYVGTGIGLAICKKIVHNHHGYITATGKPGEGSRFNIYLPVENT